ARRKTPINSRSSVVTRGTRLNHDGRLFKSAEKVSWLTASQAQPLDLDGPIDVPFEPFELDWIRRPICDRFDLVAARSLTKVAIEGGKFTFTYDEVQRASRVLAGRIDVKAPPDKPVGIFLKHSALFPIAVLACMRANRSVVPIDPNSPAERNAV